MLPLRCLAVILLLIMSSSLNAQLSSESIAKAQQYSAAHNGRAMIVKEGGQLRFERYYSGYSKGEPLHIYSGTKSFFGVLAVIADEEGLLDLDERVAETVTEWRDDPRKSQITIRETLNFTSGLETGFQEIYGRSSEDKITRAVGLDAIRERGQSFIYGPGNMNIFCEVLRRKLKRKGISYEEYLSKKLLRPLGIRVSRWREDAYGNPVPSAGMYMTGQEWIKFGEMINEGGRAGMKQIVKTENLRECFGATEINPAFGLCFWVNGNAGQPGAREVDVEEELEIEPLPEDWRGSVICNDAPRDLIVSLGSTFQRLYLVPS
ncbi:MAG: serine hydrolase domain-containing protein, partial [Verrucomicrobiota bacterium]